MYIVTIENDGIETEIHGENQKLTSGSIVKGINSIDTFSFSLLPSNIGFNRLNEFTTLVKVYNTRRNKYEFYGRVLYSNPAMSESGLIKQDVTCESYFGYLCDSQQVYVKEQNWTVLGLLEHIITTHNSQIEEYKQFEIGEVTVADANDNVYCGIQRKNTWDTIKEKLLDALGGELRFRVVDDVIYIDYLEEIGETKATTIELSKNMKSITKEKDPSEYITRLIPLGCKLTVETIETLDAVESLRAEATELEAEATELQEEVNKLFEENRALLAEHDRLITEEGYVGTETECVEIREQMDKNAEKIAKTEEEIAKINEQIQAIYTKIEEINDIEYQLALLNEEYNGYLAEGKENSAEAIALKTQIEQLTNQLKEIKGTNTKVEESEERLEISSVNDGINYIDDERAIELYGLHIGYQEWDEITDAATLKTRGMNWLAINNKVKIKYAVTALDLSLLGLDIDDFEVHNYHPIKNALLGIDDIARINKKTVNICELAKSTIEVGENFKTASELQVESAGKIEDAQATIKNIESNYVTNEQLTNETATLSSLIRQSEDNIMLSVSENYLLKTGDEVYQSDLTTALSLLKDQVLVEFTKDITTVKNDTQSEFERIYSYIKMADGSITFGASGNPITLAVGKNKDDKQSIVFYRNGVEYGSWDGEYFYTGNIVIRLNEKFQLGNFARMPRTDGSVVLLKVGG